MSEFLAYFVQLANGKVVATLAIVAAIGAAPFLFSYFYNKFYFHRLTKLPTDPNEYDDHGRLPGQRWHPDLDAEYPEYPSSGNRA